MLGLLEKVGVRGHERKPSLENWLSYLFCASGERNKSRRKRPFYLFYFIIIIFYYILVARIINWP